MLNLQIKINIEGVFEFVTPKSAACPDSGEGGSRAEKNSCVFIDFFRVFFYNWHLEILILLPDIYSVFKI